MIARRQTGHGPQLTANALRDWCSLGGSGRSYIEPGSPWQKPFVESFGSCVRDKVLAVEVFASLLEAKTVIEDWRIIYNTRWPHSSLGWKAPATYAASCNRTETTRPSRQLDQQRAESLMPGAQYCTGIGKRKVHQSTPLDNPVW